MEYQTYNCCNNCCNLGSCGTKFLNLTGVLEYSLEFLPNVDAIINCLWNIIERENLEKIKGLKGFASVGASVDKET